MDQTPADLAALKHLEPVEPDFVVETDEVQTEAERHAWFAGVGQALRTNGAAHVRYSWRDGAALVEGWRSIPANEGEPRYQPTAGKD